MRQPFEGVYIISVAARLLAMHPQTLRKYERFGLVAPSRTGFLRLYSEKDLTRLRLIKHLVDGLGLNLAGVVLVLEVAEKLEEIRELVQNLQGNGHLKGMALKHVQEALELIGAAEGPR
jgi:MerR family transcriptional regulator/heat shock protein HspR